MPSEKRKPLERERADGGKDYGENLFYNRRYKSEEYNRVIGNFEVEPLIVIPVFIHDFLCINPFNDGNGRMSRLLTTLLLCWEIHFFGGKDCKGQRLVL